MKKNIIKLLVTFLCVFAIFIMSITFTNTALKKHRYSANEKIDPTQWVAVDKAGRTVPTNGIDGVTAPTSRKVGIMYWTWHVGLIGNGGNPYPNNLSHIYAQNPSAKNDPNHSIWKTNAAVAYWWNEPIYGYYRESDSYVLRRHAELLADAGVDFVVFDCTNGSYTWENEYMNLLKVWSDAKKDGINVPKVVFMLAFNDTSAAKGSLNQIWNKVYSKNLYSDLWFYMNGAKTPLILARPEAADNATKRAFFTFRPTVSVYYLTGNQSYTKEIKWGWLSSYPQAVYMDLNGNKEMTTVGVAQNMTQEGKSTQRITAMNGSNVMGRSYASGDYKYSYKYRGQTKTIQKGMSDGTLYGRNFQQQWDFAIGQKPGYVLVTGWNEWLVQRQVNGWPPAGTRTAPVSNAFPDQFNDEYSRDVEPTTSPLKDNYYYQLVSNVRKYKGAAAQKKQSTPKTIDIKGKVSQWTDNNIIDYRHYSNANYKNRNAKQWGSATNVVYTNNTFNNDIVNAKVSYDEQYIYFYMEAVDNIKNYKNKLRLLIDTVESKNSTSTANYEEFEYIINREGSTDNTLRLEKSTGGWKWSTISDVEYVVNGKTMQIMVPRKDLGLTKTAINFNFKWADNNLTNGDIMTVYTDGDSAPGGRFAFHFEGSSIYSPTNYTITYNLNGGSVSGNPTTYNIETNTITLKNPTRTGYTFDGWTGSNGKTPQKTVTIAKGSTGNKSYTANWTPVVYNITYSLNGGTNPGNPATYSVDTANFTLKNPTKTGYTFTGWTGSNGNTAQTSVSIAKGSTGNKSYTANFAPMSYTITYNLNGGSVSGNPTTYNIESNAITLKNPTRVGYTFTGWTGSNGNAAQTSVSIAKGSTGNKTYKANWKVNKYKITFNSNGGSSVAAIEANYASQVNKPSDPTKAGYTFAGWYSDSGLTSSYTFSTMPAENITLYAKWTANTNTITYKLNGGTNHKDNPTTYKTGEEKELKTPTKTGSTFGGWYLDSAFNNKIEKISGQTTNITLYAKWQVNKYKITFNSNGGSSVAEIEANYGSKVTSPAAPTKTGYSFGGWFTEPELTNRYTFNTMPAGNIALYAKWNPVNYKIIYNLDGASVSGNPDIYNIETNTITLKNPTKTGYTFTGWTGSNGNTAQTSVSIAKGSTGDKTYTANFTPINYTIAYNLNGGSVSGQTTSYNIESNDITLPTPTKEGYTFTGWTGSNGTKATKTVTISKGSTGNKSYTANWTINKIYIKMNMNGGYLDEEHGDTIGASGQLVTLNNSQNIHSLNYGTNLPSTGLANYNNNTYINIKKEGYKAVGGAEWKTQDGSKRYNQATQYQASDFCDAKNGNCTATLYVNWEPVVYKITYKLNSGTVSSANPATYTIESDTFTLTNPTRKGYTFSGWSGTDLSEKTTNVSVAKGSTGDRTYTANFTANNYTISFNTNGGGAVSSITKAYGSKVTAPAAPTKSGYKFAGWYSNSGLTNLYTFSTMPAEDIILYAKWTAGENTINYELNGGINDTDNPTTYVTGEEKVLKVPSKKGSTFAGWYLENTYQTKVDKISNTMNGDITLYARWNKGEYTITFNSNGGSPVASITADYNEEITEPAAPTRTGYKFAGWYSDEELTNSYTFNKMPDKDITLYAKWNANTYTVKFNTNGGSAVANSKIKYGETASEPTTPVKEGNSFTGWYTTSTLTEKYNFGLPVYASKTLYAGWNKNKYQVIYDTNGGSEIGNTEVEFGQAVPRPNDPTKEGYKFTGWLTETKEEYTFGTMPGKDVTLYADWDKEKYNITYELEGGTVSGQKTSYDIETNTFTLKNPTRVGYTFTGWTGSNGNTAQTTVRVEKGSVGNKNYKANWKPTEYSITYRLNGGRVTSANPTTYNIETDSFTLKNPTREGYTFSGWSGTDITENTDSLSVAKGTTGDRTYIANWNTGQYTITFNSNGGSQVASITADYNEEISNPEDPTKEGYTFAGWYSDEGLTNEYEFTRMPDENITLYAKWDINIHIVHFNTNGGTGLADIKVKHGETLTKPSAPSKEGYTFNEWYSDEGLAMTYNFDDPVNTDITLYAKWTANKYKVIYDTNGGNEIPSVEVTYKEQVPHPDDPEKEGYKFIGWLKDAVEEYTFGVMPAEDLRLYANWEGNQYEITFNSNGGSQVSSITKSYGEEITEPDAPTKEGYKFAGWYSDEELAKVYSFTTMPSKNITLYAKWVENENVIRYQINGGEIPEDSPTSYKTAEEIVLKEATKENYRFTGWYLDEQLTRKIETITTDMNDDITLYAGWVANKYKIIFNTDGGTKMDTLEVEYDSEMPKIENPTKEGYRFIEWYLDSDFTQSYRLLSMPGEDVKLYARFEPSTHYKITFETNGGSDMNLLIEEAGKEIESPNDPVKEGYKFAGWFVDKDLTELYSFNVMPDEDITLYARWVTNDEFVIRYILNGGENDKRNPTSYKEGEIPNIISPSKEGYIFAGWYLDSEFTKEFHGITEQTAGDITLYAKWEKESLIVKVPKTAKTLSILLAALGILLITISGIIGYKTLIPTNNKKK